MFKDTELNRTLLENPASIQTLMLTELENRLLGGEKIVDGNNVCTFILEMSSTLNATSINAMNSAFEPLYPVRAATSEDLYKHMSTWDYVNLFSTPASTEINLFLDVDYIIRHGIDVNDSYKKIVIPESTIFNIASYEFGIYYPIEIRINKRTKQILVVHDTSRDNPLHMLVQNTIPHSIRAVNQMKGLFITIPVYQFKKRVMIENVDEAIGFTKSYEYPDKFYAARVYVEQQDGSWIETKQTLSEDVYDPYTVTAKLAILAEDNKVQIRIPQVYFDRKMINSRIKVEVYSSIGELSIDLTGVNPDTYTWNFNKDSTDPNYKYTSIFNHIPTAILLPASNRLQGGGNGYGFEELKRRVINNSFYSDVLISNDELTKHFEDIGFVVEKHLDNITDRIYYCRKILTNKKNELLAAGDIPIRITDELITNTSTLLNTGAGDSLIILPNTLFKYDWTNRVCIPVTDSEIDILNQLPKSELLDHMNNPKNLYTKTPFHIRLEMSDRFPLANTYDLHNPKVTNTEFVTEDVGLFTQVAIGNVNLTQLHDTMEGYKCTFLVYPSDNLKDRISSGDVDISNSDQFVLLVSIGGKHQLAHFVQTNANGAHEFEFMINTSYRITREHRITTTSFVDSSGDNMLEIDLESTFFITGMLKSSLLLETTSVGSPDFPMIPGNFLQYTPLTTHSIRLSLGQLITEVYNGVNIIYSELEYDTYPIDVYKKYDKDVYVRDDNGVPVYTVDENNNVALSYEHVSGDWVFKYDDVGIIHTIQPVSEGEVRLQLDNVSGISVGFGVSGYNIPQDTIVTEVDNNSNTITINRGVEHDITTESDIKVGELVLLHQAGEKVIVGGEPSVKTLRNLEYLVDSIQIDDILSYETIQDNISYMNNIRDDLRSYFGSIRASKDQLLSNTKLFFKPTNSLGTGLFKLDIENTFSMNVQFSVGIKLFIDTYTNSNRQLLTAMRETILKIIDDTLMSGSISATDISDKIKIDLVGEVKYVDVLGFNNDIKLQTLLPNNASTVPNLARRLVLSRDGETISERALDLEFITI